MASQQNFDHNAAGRTFICKESLVEELVSNRSTEISMAISMIQNSQKFYRQNKKLLLVGKSGVGKSMLAKAIAFKAGALIVGRFLSLSGIYAQFKSEKVTTPTVLIVDNLECMFQDPKEMGILAGLLDSFKNNPNIFFIGTATNTEKMPDRIRSRFGSSIVKIGEPDFIEREKIFRYCLGKKHNLSDKYIKYIARVTTGLVARDIKAIAQKSHTNAIFRNSQILEQQDCEKVIADRKLGGWYRFLRCFPSLPSLNTNQKNIAFEFVKGILPTVMYLMGQYMQNRMLDRLYTEQFELQQKMFNEHMNTLSTMFDEHMENLSKQAAMFYRSL